MTSIRTHHKPLRLLALLSLCALALPALASAQGRPTRGHWGEEQLLRLRAGVSNPRGESAYWDDKRLDFNGGVDDFEDTIVGIDYIRLLGGRLGLVGSLDAYQGNTRQSYLGFIDETGGEILHDTDLEVASATLGLMLNLAGRDARLVPYVGLGAGFYSWTLNETGDFIDFDTQDLDIFFASFEDDGSTFGMYWQAGVDAPISSSWSVFADARWQRAKDDLAGELQGLGELDLSGRAITFGAAVSF